MKKRLTTLLIFVMALLPFVNAQTVTDKEPAKVLFISDITPENLVKIYNVLNKPVSGKVAVKISTGESAQSNHLRPELIGQLIKEVEGTIVECNTAYGGNRSNTENHRRAIEERGYGEIATVDIMDEEGYVDLPVADTKYLQYNRVGSHLANYDFLINLAHFKGHAMGGFGGVLKNQSIGIATPEGKTLIHTAGVYDDTRYLFQQPHGQDGFLESMAAAAQSVHDYFKGNVIYINVMNNLSVDCDCDGHPSAPQMKDIGILASLDPVALDKACLDLIFNHQSTAGDNSTPLVNRINDRHGAHIVDYAAEIGLGTLEYELIDITDANGIDNLTSEGVKKYNVYDLNGNRILTNADSIDSLAQGIYIINGIQTIIGTN
ncbi:MAG: DUF362 domain-containing protein [Bacteroides sp.]|nr:DUF362 domain-containing protein [Bacteroides sp.]